MKKETEVVIRGLLASDKSVAPEDIEKAIAYLQGRRDEDEDLTHVIRYKDVLKWLKIHRRTLDDYIQRGYLKRVYGGGETRHRRFAGQLPQVHRKAVGKMRARDEDEG